MTNAAVIVRTLGGDVSFLVSKGWANTVLAAIRGIAL
jgi:hypothetical protein